MVTETISSCSRPRLVFLLVFLCATFIPVEHCLAQGKGGEDMEQFEGTCPYTKGERELEQKLGYERFGFITWRKGEDSTTIQETMGAIPMLWVETPHFRIGSSLGTFKLDNDREQRTRLKGEFSRLKGKLGKLRAPKKSLDPYLRLHLYAQRAEELYAQFMEDFQIDPEGLPANAPHLGHRNKFLLLLCQRKSEYGRYLKSYEQIEAPFSYRTGWHSDGMIVALSQESVSEPFEDKDLPFDVMLHCLLANTLASSFVDGFEQNLFKAPPWVTYGLAHVYSKRVDPHWTYFDARRESQINYADAWNWEPRVRNLVQNEFFTTTEKMLGWTTYADLGARDHMIAWSKMQYLVEVAEGDRQKFLSLACRPLSSTELGDSEPNKEPALRQRRALQEAFGLTPEELDEAWGSWVSKTYKKR